MGTRNQRDQRTNERSMSTRKPYRAILNRAHGYTAQVRRLSQVRRARHRAQRAWNVAQVIAERYAAIERRWPAMALVFEQADRTSLSVTNMYQTTHTSLFMTPRLLLRMLAPHGLDRLHAVADRPRAQSFSVKAVPMTVAIPSRSQQKNEEHDDVIARIVRRRVREELPSIINAKQSGRTLACPAQGKLEEQVSSEWQQQAKLYRRTAPIKAEASVGTTAVHAEGEGASVTGRRDVGAAALGHPPVDIARITDQVLHVLDRRIVAQRERMGVS